MHNVAMERNHQIFGRGRLIKLIYRDKSGLPFGKIFERNVARAAIIRACLGGGGYIFFHSFILILNCLIFFRFCLRFRRFTEHIFYHFQTFQLCGSCQFSQRLAALTFLQGWPRTLNIRLNPLHNGWQHLFFHFLLQLLIPLLRHLWAIFWLHRGLVEPLISQLLILISGFFSLWFFSKGSRVFTIFEKAFA